MKQAMLSAGAVILRRAPEGCRYLLLRCYHYWDFPKGQVEAGEAPFDAACREVQEETALDALDFAWGQTYCETPPYGAGKVARYYLAVAHDPAVQLLVNPELGLPEHHEYRWLSYPSARALLAPRLLPVLDWAHDISRC